MRISDWSSDVCSSDLGLVAEFDRIVLPVPGRDHPPVEIEDARQFDPAEPDLARTRGGAGERGDISHQARSRWSSCSASSASSRSRSASISQRINSIFCVWGSKISLNGVP